MQHPVIALATKINQLAKKVNETEGLQRDLGIMMCSLAIVGMCDDIGIKEPVEVGHMLFSNALQGAGINHNVRIIRDVLAGKEVSCGMCPACKAADAKKPEVQEEEIPHELVSMLSKMFGAENVTVIHVDNSNSLSKTRH